MVDWSLVYREARKRTMPWVFLLLIALLVFAPPLLYFTILIILDALANPAPDTNASDSGIGLLMLSLFVVGIIAMLGHSAWREYAGRPVVLVGRLHKVEFVTHSRGLRNALNRFGLTFEVTEAFEIASTGTRKPLPNLHGKRVVRANRKVAEYLPQQELVTLVCSSRGQYALGRLEDMLTAPVSRSVDL